jgi:ABC-type Fe3+-siderophore transport system permease subunit
MKKKIHIIIAAFIISALSALFVSWAFSDRYPFEYMFPLILSGVLTGFFFGYKDKDENKKDVTKK